MEKLIKVRSHIEGWWFDQMGKVDCSGLLIQSNLIGHLSEPMKYDFVISHHPNANECKILIDSRIRVVQFESDFVDAFNANLDSLTLYIKPGQSIDPLPEMEVQDESK